MHSLMTAQYRSCTLVFGPCAILILAALHCMAVCLRMHPVPARGRHPLLQAHALDQTKKRCGLWSYRAQAASMARCRQVQQWLRGWQVSYAWISMHATRREQALNGSTQWRSAAPCRRPLPAGPRMDAVRGSRSICMHSPAALTRLAGSFQRKASALQLCLTNPNLCMTYVGDLAGLS
jgi:hypothetical protein